MALDTRLMRMSSKDRMDPQSSTTNFSTSFGNAGTMFPSSIMGMSVEHVSFPNFIQNVPHSHAHMSVTVTGHPNLGNATVMVEMKSGQYSVGNFVDALNAAYDAVGLSAGGVAGIIFTVVDLQAEGVTENIQMSFPGWGPGGTTRFNGTTRRLPRIIGYKPTDVDGNALYQINAGNVLFRSNLGGESCVYLHSTKFTAGHEGLSATAVQSDGLPFYAISSIPVDVPFGFFVQFNNGADTTRPVISWPVPSGVNFSTMDLSLRDHHGDVVDIGAGELEVTIRLWMSS